ncbi:TetR/AcrR family transcriptional regulator [Amorphus orientalis]|uniref:AcrR family transcriptional regulator n=1 Tax=Amorphus orientalis TaxID=649198 RepID=A0AAE3VLY2_9HYPH|nr:TetR/AcrR family transcriptional regulator [Amorphus orientalis]MDQ0314483.1 AcrR family transcriptional regulator [Amorphus orientalis]
MSNVSTVRKPRASRRNSPRRELIVRRAAELFEEQGVAHTSIEEIAAECGVTRESIYYYFSDKVDILIEIIKPESISLDSGLQRILGLDISVREKLVLAVENHLHRFNPNYTDMVVAVRRMRRAKQDARLVEMLNIWRHYQRNWVSLIQEGQKTGEIPGSFDAKVVAYAILGMCNSPSTWYRPSASLTIGDLSNILVAIATNGIFTEK